MNIKKTIFMRKILLISITIMINLITIGSTNRNSDSLCHDQSQGLSIAGIQFSGNSPVSSQIIWTEVQPAGDINLYWTCSAISADGSRIIAGTNGKLYLSSDGGNSWTEAIPYGESETKFWECVAISGDGSTLLAGVIGEYLFISTDSGQTWNIAKANSYDPSNWTSVAVSGDGTYLMAADGVNLYVSQDKNLTWSLVDGDNNSQVSVSSGGNFMAATKYTDDYGEYVYKLSYSNNYGNNWNTINLGNSDWNAISVSGNGSTTLAASGRLYLTANSGTTWTETLPNTNMDFSWRSVSVSGDGSIMIAAIENDPIFLSTDGGANWSETQPRGSGYYLWTTVSVSADGSTLLAGYSDGRLYKGTFSGAPAVEFNGNPVFSSITTNSAHATGLITSTNGADASHVGAVIYEYTDTDKIIDDAGVTQEDSTGNFGTGDFPVLFTSLSANTHYNARIYATNPSGTGYSVRDAFWTMANIPWIPTLNNGTATTFDITINASGNPDSTLFAIQDSINGTYLQSNGSLGDTAIWQTAGAWSTKTITGLITGTTYYFRVKAKNGGETETAFGIAASEIPMATPSVTIPDTTWTETQPNGNLDNYWSATAISSDGSRILSAISGGRIYIYSNSVWAETYPPGGTAENKSWISVSLSGDGSRMLAAVNDGRIYMYNNDEWTETYPPGGTAENQWWSSVSVSADGSRMLAAVYEGRIYIYSNGTWSETYPPGGTVENQKWISVSVSADGNSMLATISGGRIYMYSNNAWTETLPTGIGEDKEWCSVSVSADGSSMLAAVNDGRIYLYSNGSWAETYPPGGTCENKWWRSVSVSGDGSKMLAAVYGGRAYQYSNGVWTETYPPGGTAEDQWWELVSVSSDGSTIMAGIQNGRIYLGGNQAPITNISETSATGNGKIISLNGGGDATNRGCIYYPYTDSDKIIGDVSVTNVSTDGAFGTGGFTADLTGLSVNAQYNLRAHATNTGGIGYSKRCGFWTLANIPGAPTVGNATSTTLDIVVNINSNPENTTFALQDSVNNTYIQPNGTRVATAVWQTAAAWDTITVTGLTTGTTYYFRVKARNGEAVETAFSLTTARNTCSNPTNGGTISANQEICYGSAPQVLINVAHASNYGGVREYQWQSSTTSNTTSFSDINGADTAGYVPGTLTQTTWYRRLSRVSCKPDWVDATSSNVVKITVDPATVGGSVSGDTLVCYGSHSSVLTLLGQTGNVQKWQYSTDGTNWSDLTGHTQTTYTAENLITDTWYRAVVQSGVCQQENSDAHKISVFSNYKISGYAKYENNPKTPLSGLKVLLRNGSDIVDSVVTTAAGYYEFGGLTNGNYALIVKSSHPSGQWQTWGGVNNTDYLLVSKHIAGTQYLPVNPPVVRTTASTKMPHPLINTADATAIRQAAKFPATGWQYFDIPKWVFSGTTAATRIDTFELVCADVTRDIRGLCSGDVNGTYVPVSGYKVAEPGLELVHEGVLAMADEMIFPVRIVETLHATSLPLEIGAITLYLDYDPSVMVVTNVTFGTTVTNSPELWFNVPETTVNLKPETLNTLQIGWMSTEPISVVENETVLLIHARLTKEFRISHFTFSDSRFESEKLNLKPEMRNVKCEISFALNDTQISEFADGDGNVIGGLKLSIPDARIDDGNVKTLHATSLPMAITVYPNPAQSTLNLKLETINHKPKTLNLELLNLQATKVWGVETQTIGSGWNEFQVDVSDLAPGIYFLKANVGGEILMKKVLISR